jgi:hypothetical protein
MFKYIPKCCSAAPGFASEVFEKEVYKQRSEIIKRKNTIK